MDSKKIYECNYIYGDKVTYNDLGLPVNYDVQFNASLFNKDYYNKTFYKWLNDDYTHFNYKYKPLSINVDVLNFVPRGECAKGGLYFTDRKNILNFNSFGKHLHEIKILPKTPVYSEKFKAKAPAFYLGREIDQKSPEFFDIVFESECVNSYGRKSANSYGRRIIPSILEYSSNIDYNFLDKPISISNCVYQCINNKNTNELFGKTLKKIKDIYIPELKRKYISGKQCLLQSTYNFEKFLLSNVSHTIVETLKKTGAVISGSSVLKFMLGEKYKISDLDIYCNEIDYIKIYDSIYTHANTNKKYATFKRPYNKNKKLLANSYNMENIVDVIDIKFFVGLKIQIIVVKNNISPENFIKKNFDFDFCKCTYDGMKFNVLENPNIIGKSGKICDEYMIKCFKEKDIYSIYRISKTAERIIKYIKRGYDITNYDVFFENIINFGK